MLKQNIFFVCFVFLAGFMFSCEEEAFDPILSLDGAPQLTAPDGATSYVITEDTQEDELFMISWTPADFGVEVGPSYTVQADLVGNDFAEPVNLVPATNQTSVSVIAQTVNNMLISRDVAGGTAQDIEVRVLATAGRSEDGNVQTSAPLTLNVTPFEAERIFPSLFVPGAHQGWDPASAPLIYDTNDDGRYEGYIYFADPNNEFKFTDAPNWDNGNFGDDDGDGGFEDGGGNIMVTEPGYYRLNVDLNERTYTATATNWGIIGEATPTGWDNDTDFVYNADTGALSITLDMTAGEFKFRANDAWDIDFGDNGGDGTLEYGGDNLTVAEAGNYTVELLLSQPIYTYTITKN